MMLHELRFFYIHWLFLICTLVVVLIGYIQWEYYILYLFYMYELLVPLVHSINISILFVDKQLLVH